MNNPYTTQISGLALPFSTIGGPRQRPSDHDLLTISLQLLTQMVLTFDPENISTRCWPLNICTQVGQYDCKNIWWSTCHPYPASSQKPPTFDTMVPLLEHENARLTMMRSQET